MNERIPPHDLDAERAVLGTMLVNREHVPVVASVLTVADFYAHVHAPIFAAIFRLFDQGQPIDKITLAAELRRVDLLEKCGGPAYLSLLLDTVQSASSAEYYAKIVAEKATLRRVIGAGNRLFELGFEGEYDVRATIAEAERVFAAAIAPASFGVEPTLEAAIREAWELVAGAAERREAPGITSPWSRFDRFTGRTFPGELVAWGAGPGMGKSIALAQLALHVAATHGSVAFFALEMGVRETVRRMLAKQAQLSSRRLRLGDLRGDDWDRLSAAMGQLITLPVTLFDRFPAKSVSDVRRSLSRMATKAPVSAVVIDHANFLSDATAAGRTSKHERLDGVYQGLLQIASEFGCVMHVVQHLNREGMNNKPSLAHLRDGGNLEGHAHIVVFPYRADIANAPDTGEFIIAKNRDGDIGTIPMTFDGPRLEWRERSPREEAA